MKVLRYLAWIAAALVALATLFAALVVVINWHDVPPSANYLLLRKAIADRPPIPDADNAYVYLLGFGVGPEADPQEVGARRLAWLEELDRDIGKLQADPAGQAPGFSGERSTAVVAYFMACNADEPHDCRQAFDSAPGPDGWSDRDRELLARYRELITHTAWREHVGNDFSQPLPAYADVLAGQRLALLALRGADVQTLRDSMSRDLAFWRQMLGSTDLLITKMIAVAGVRQHFQFGNLLLRHAPADGRTSAIPDGWRQPITRSELSLRRVMSGELTLLESSWRSHSDAIYFKDQDISNEMAADYLELVRAFDVPLADYPRTGQRWSMRPARHPFLSRIYDVGGDYLRQNGIAEYHGYPLRIAASEAWRRAALTTAGLRESGMPASQVPGALERATLRNPFDGSAFAWSDAEQAVIYLGTEDQSRGRRRQVYAY